MTLIAHNLVVLLAQGPFFVYRELQVSDFKAQITDEVNFVCVFAEHVSVVNDSHFGLLTFTVDIGTLAS